MDYIIKYEAYDFKNYFFNVKQSLIHNLCIKNLDKIRGLLRFVRKKWSDVRTFYPYKNYAKICFLMNPYLSILITITLFSTVEVAVRLLGTAIDPMLLAFIRYFSSGLLFILISIPKIKEIKKKDFFKIFFLGFIGISIAISMFHFALIHISAAKGALIFSINPLFSSIYAWFLIKEELFNKIKALGIFVGFIGVYIASLNKSGLSSSGSFKGVFLMLVAAMFFGIYISMSKSLNKKYGAMPITALSFILGSIFFLPMVESWKIDYSATNILLIVYLSVIATGIAYICYFYGLKRVSISAGTSFFYLKPILASVFALYILPDEHLGINFFMGLAIVLLGLYISNKKMKVKS